MIHALESLVGDFPEFLLEGVNQDVLIRLGFSAVAGTVIGIERERHGRAAGLRTQLLVCLAACIAMILSDAFYQRSFLMQQGDAGWHPDPARLAAGVLAGMGFLGAGVILQQSNHTIRGVTTAATLWFVTMIGMAFGAGAIGIGIIATMSAMLILGILPLLESRIQNDWYSDLKVWFSPEECSLEKIIAAMKPLEVKVKGVDIKEDFTLGTCVATFHLRYKRKRSVVFPDLMISAIRQLPGVSRITFKS